MARRGGVWQSTEMDGAHNRRSKASSINGKGSGRYPIQRHHVHTTQIALFASFFHVLNLDVMLFDSFQIVTC
jgi:hypothetical protein